MNENSNLNNQDRKYFHYLQWSDQGKSGLIRYILGAVLVLTISLFFGQLFAVVGSLLIHSNAAAATIVKSTFFGFIASFLLLPLVPWLLNRRPWWSIAMPKKSFELKYLLAGAAVSITTMLLVNSVSYLLNPSAFKYVGFNVVSWVSMLFIAAVAFFVQSSVEEMTYRGYLAQFVYRFSKYPLLFLGIPAFIFSIPHLGNIEGSTGFLGLLPYISLGLGYGWVAYRSGSLWMGAGLHATNNWFITMFVGSAAEKVEKVSLFMVHGNTTDKTLIIGTFVQLVLVVVISEIVMRKFNLVRSNLLQEKKED